MDLCSGVVHFQGGVNVFFANDQQCLDFPGLILKVVLLVDVRCSSRDYRMNAPRRNPEAVAWYATVPGDVGVIFQCIGACTPRTFKLNTLISLELSA
jgi:hypothetical protein